MKTVETLNFNVNTAIMKHLITSQSGTIEKALLEGIANSIDGGATAVHVKLSTEAFSIADDGIGFPTEDRILACFADFGFDHEQAGNERGIGRFGIGRGQMFAFGRNSWRSHTFDMVVDIEAQGFKSFDLHRGMPDQPGLTITCTFFKPLSYSQKHDTEVALRRLVRFAAVPVFLNGKQISENPADAKWDHEDEYGYYAFRKDGELAVYSQGLFVMDFSQWRYGVAGRIVTKVPHSLQQNMARSDLLASTCPIWKHCETIVRKYAKTLTDNASKSKTLTDGMRQVLARQALANGTGWHEPVFTLSNRRHVGLWRLIGYPRLTSAPDQHRLADRALQDKSAAVLSPVTLARFGVDTVTELVALLSETLQEHKQTHYLEQLRRMQVSDRFEDSGLDKPMSAAIVRDKDLKEGQRIALRALRSVHERLSEIVAPGTAVRRLVAGDSTSADGWTDGLSYIAINKRLLTAGAQPTPTGFLRLVSLVVHELLHNQDTEGDHGHDFDFYEHFHELMLDTNVMKCGFDAFAFSLRGGRTISRPKLSCLEKFVDIDQELGDASLCGVDPDEEGAASDFPPALALAARQ